MIRHLDLPPLREGVFERRFRPEKRIDVIRIITSTLIAAMFFFAIAVCTKSFASDVLDGGEELLVIHSETLEIDNKNQRVIFTGNVVATRSSFTIRCEIMHLYYTSDALEKTEGPEDMRVDRVEARGDVKITRFDGGEAMAEEAVYYQKDDKVILSGNAVVKQGEDFVEGARITFYIEERRSVVESDAGEQVRAVIYPGGRKR